MSEIKDSNANTIFIGHKINVDYIRRLVRRNIVVISTSYSVTTKDGYKVRVKPLAITGRMIQSSIENILRNKIEETVQKYGNGITIDKFVDSILTGKLSRSIYNGCKRIYPFRKVEISSSEIEYIPEKILLTEEK